MTKLGAIHNDLICPFCRSALFPDAIVHCPSCGTAHHQSCWWRHRRCSVFGCNQASRTARFGTFPLTASVLLTPLFIMMILTAIHFWAVTFEFGWRASYQTFRYDTLVPSAFLTILLVCGFYTFYMELVHD